MNGLKHRNYVTLAELRHLLRKFLRFSKDFLAETAGLTPQQYEVMLAIKAFTNGANLTIAQLSHHLQVKHHTAVSAVDRLVERKLITRRPGQQDRRRRYLELTNKGGKLIAKLAAAHFKDLRGRSSEIIEALERLRN